MPGITRRPERLSYMTGGVSAVDAGIALLITVPQEPAGSEHEADLATLLVTPGHGQPWSWDAFNREQPEAQQRACVTPGSGKERSGVKKPAQGWPAGGALRARLAPGTCMAAGLLRTPPPRRYHFPRR